jgi:hypothetical protein
MTIEQTRQRINDLYGALLAEHLKRLELQQQRKREQKGTR